MGWQIVRHSFVLLFRNLPDALRVSVGPVLLAVVFFVLVFMILGLSVNQIVFDLSNGVASASLLLAMVLGLIAVIFISAWIAVAWHRFILLEEYPGTLPAIAGRPIWPYAGRSITLGLIMLLALLPAAIIGGLLMQLLGQSNVISLMLGFVLGVYLSFLWMRFAVLLPATAIGRPMKMADAWAATAPFSNDILTASAILVTLNLIVSTILSLLAIGFLGTLLDIAISWVTLMVGTSILTTLYGIAVEKRALPA